jgi:DNA-binding CsgD family transcriptional regulator
MVSSPHHPDTPTEIKIAALVAEGLSNPVAAPGS